jgi:hypothetical protein
LNGFEVGADGWIMGPLWFKGQIVKINPANGEMKVVNSEFKTPAAANYDSKGNFGRLIPNSASSIASTLLTANAPRLLNSPLA